MGETAYTGSGDPPCAAPTCSELRETVNSEVNTSVSEMGNFEFMDSSLESILCSGMSSVDATTSSGKGEPPSAAPSGYTGSKLRETANSKALVEDAALCDVRGMSEGLLATMIQEYDTELEEAAALYDVKSSIFAEFRTVVRTVEKAVKRLLPTLPSFLSHPFSPIFTHFPTYSPIFPFFSFFSTVFFFSSLFLASTFFHINLSPFFNPFPPFFGQGDVTSLPILFWTRHLPHTRY